MSEHQDPVTGRFLPGNNANPGGRPKGRGMRAALNRLLASDRNEQGVDMALATWAVKLIMDKDNHVPTETKFEIWKELWDRTEGGKSPVPLPHEDGPVPPDPTPGDPAEPDPPPDDPEEARRLEIYRLDVLAASLWPAAEGGCTKSANALIRIAGMRTKLLGLGAPPPQESTAVLEEKFGDLLDKRYGTPPPPALPDAAAGGVEADAG